jgi:hypothetical protein
MKKVLAVLVVCLALSNVQAVTMDSLTWENKYECDALPTAAGWTADGVIVASAAGSILTLNDLSVAGDQSGWYNIASNVNFANGATIEFRCRVNDVTANDNYQAASVRFYDSASRIANIGFGQIGSTQYAWSNVPGGGMGVVFGGWHTYRITALTSEGIKWYVDDNPTVVNSGAIATWGETTVQFGDFTGGADANWDIDYIRWTNAGAFAAPEPASMCLVLTGLLFARKRK